MTEQARQEESSTPNENATMIPREDPTRDLPVRLADVRRAAEVLDGVVEKLSLIHISEPTRPAA